MNKHLTEKQIEEINGLYWVQNISSRQIALNYPINFNHVQRVCFKNRPKNINARSFKSHSRKLDEYRVTKIMIGLMKYGTSQREMAKKYGVSQSSISAIALGKSWKHIFQKCTKKYKTEILAVS